MWRVIKNMYDINKSAVLREGEISEQFNIGQGVAQGYAYPLFHFH